jgi:hypothetical protein
MAQRQSYSAAANSSTVNPETLTRARRAPGAKSFPWCTGTEIEARPVHFIRTCDPVCLEVV